MKERRVAFLLSLLQGKENCMRRVQTMNWWLVVVGLLVAVAPFAFGFYGIAAALWTFLVVGLAVAVLAGISASIEEEGTVKLLDWITAALGVALILAPFVLGYMAVMAALYTGILGGAAVVALAVWGEVTLGREMGHAL